MSFLEGLSRFLQGKPVFEDPNAPQNIETKAPESPSSESARRINKADQNTFPVVRIGQVSSDESDGRLQVHGEVKNEWHEEVILDAARLFGGSRKLNVFLGADEEREVLLYDGPALKHPHYDGQLDFKTKNEGDYFQAVFEAKLDYDADSKTYSTDELRLRLPIRDING